MRPIDRDGVGQALRARRTFATTGERSFASLRLGHVWMGETAALVAGQPLTFRLIGDQGWEEIALWDADACLLSRNLHDEAGFSTRRFRVRIGGARIKDRYRAAYWSGEIKITGASILSATGVGFDHPEQTVWRQDATTIGFRTATHGDIDAIEIEISNLVTASITVDARICGYPKVGDVLAPPPHVHAPTAHLDTSGSELCARGGVKVELAGVELFLAIERMSDAKMPRTIGGEISLEGFALDPRQNHALFIAARQRNQSRIWTSPLFLRPA